MGDYVSSVNVSMRRNKEPYKTEINIKDANKKSRSSSSNNETETTSIAEKMSKQLQKSFAFPKGK